MTPIKGLKGRCLISCMAMLLDTTPQDLIEELGEDGLDIWWPTSLNPEKDWLCRRGHHIQELAILAETRGKALVDMSPLPALANPRDLGSTRPIWSDSKARENFYHYLKKYPALLLSGTHAYASDTTHVYDPDTLTKVPIEDFASPVRGMWVLM